MSVDFNVSNEDSASKLSFLEKSAQATTPMMKQYYQLKNKYPEAILFFRLGDFYEMFDDDAIFCAKILGLTLTKRATKSAQIPMCGIPHHASLSYLAKLVKAGFKVALCEQISDPNLPGIVEREVTKIITPGTWIDEISSLDRENVDHLTNFIVSVVYESAKNKIYACLIDVVTGQNFLLETNLQNFKEEIQLRNCREIIIPENSKSIYKKLFEDIDLNLNNLVFSEQILPHDSENFLKEFYQIYDLQALGIENLSKMTWQALTRAISYLMMTDKSNLNALSKPKIYDRQQLLLIDKVSYEHLEIFKSPKNIDQSFNLFYFLNQTHTVMGARLLQKFLWEPTQNRFLLEQRYDDIDIFKGNPSLLKLVRNTLADIYDLERLSAKILNQSINPKELKILENNLILLQNLSNELAKFHLSKQINHHQIYDVIDLLKKYLSDDPPLDMTQGFVIRDAFNSDLDDCRRLVSDVKTTLSQLEFQEKSATGINSLKIKQMPLGYVIEISKGALAKIPAHYVLKQTLVNASRFVTTELLEQEMQISNRTSQLFILEAQLFQDLLNLMTSFAQDLQKLAYDVAYIDVISTFSDLSLKYHLVRPEIIDQKMMKIVKAKHPLLMSKVDYFEANDLNFNHLNFLLLSGPNMGGKSTYLKTVGLLAFMAQIGCFVSAESMQFSLCDAIFTRVGANDDLAKGHSTFMVEMLETARIINQATDKSLVLLDEIGRGTSTYDGLSLASALTEFFSNQLNSLTIFATHYHELINLVENLPYAKNISVEVLTENKNLIFTHRVILKPAYQSFGLQVAQMAGIPAGLIKRAKDIHHQLMNQNNLNQINEKIALNLFDEDNFQAIFADNSGKEVDGVDAGAEAGAGASFTSAEAEVLAELKALKLEQMTPLQALQILSDYQNHLT